MRRVLRWMLWPGVLVVLILASLAVNTVLVVVATRGEASAVPLIGEGSQ